MRINYIIKNCVKKISTSQKWKNPSASRNQGPILDVLKFILNKNAENLKLLEISSGTGQHVAYFAEYFPNITFQPSEFDKSMFSSIQAYAESCRNKNVQSPIFIDIRDDFIVWEKQFSEGEFDYMLNINMIHISPWSCSEGLFRNASKLLKSRGNLITYGPYAVDGLLTPESNVLFNNRLQSENPEWGIKDTRDLKALAAKYGIEMRQTYNMPANNMTIIWEKS